MRRNMLRRTISRMRRYIKRKNTTMARKTRRVIRKIITDASIIIKETYTTVREFL